MFGMQLITHYGFWLILGMLLIIGEVLTPGVFVAIFFGFGALLVGVLTWLGIITSGTWQLLGFGCFSIALLLVARRRFQNLLKGEVSGAAQSASNDMLGKPVTVLEDFSHGRGVVSFRGARWLAVSDEPLKQGDSARITAQANITLTVASQTEN